MAVKKTLVISWLISFSHACRMMKKLNAKKHAHAGYYFELEDLNGSVWKNRSKADRVYGDYSGAEQGCVLKVFRDVPIKA